MARQIPFTLFVNEQEKWMIGELAGRLQRTQSDAIRFVVREKLRELLERENSGEGLRGKLDDSTSETPT